MLADADFEFVGLDVIERTLRALDEGPAVEYIAVSDKTDPDTPEQTIAKFELNSATARRYLDAARPAPARPGAAPPPLSPPGEDPDDEDEDEEDEDEAPHLAPPPPSARLYLGHRPPLAWPQVLETAVTWLRDTLKSESLGETGRIYRVRIHGPKGQTCLTRRRVIVSHRRPEPAPLPVVEAPPPDFDLKVRGAAAQSMVELGHCWTQYGRATLNAFQQAQTINDGMLLRLDKRLGGSEQNVNQLVDSLLQLRVSEHQLDAEAATERGRHARTEATLQRGISSLERLGEMYILGSLGLPAHLKPLLPALNKIAAHPELVQALSDPRVQSLIETPGNAKQIADLLKMAAANDNRADEDEDEGDGDAPAPSEPAAPAAKADAPTPGAEGAPASEPQQPQAA